MCIFSKKALGQLLAGIVFHRKVGEGFGGEALLSIVLRLEIRTKRDLEPSIFSSPSLFYLAPLFQMPLKFHYFSKYCIILGNFLLELSKERKSKKYIKIQAQHCVQLLLPLFKLLLMQYHRLSYIP